MNPEIKKKWVEALRSGEYKQAKHALRVNDRFCCLGVLCDLYSKEMNQPWDERNENGTYNYMVESLFLPKCVQNWAGISDVGHFREDSGFIGNLTKLNDDGITFDRIATIIEVYSTDN